MSDKTFAKGRTGMKTDKPGSEKSKSRWEREMIPAFKSREIKFSNACRLGDIEDALFWAVYNTRERFGPKKTREHLKFVFRKDNRRLVIRLNEVGQSFSATIGEWIALSEKSGVVLEA